MADVKAVCNVLRIKLFYCKYMFLFNIKFYKIEIDRRVSLSYIRSKSGSKGKTFVTAMLRPKAKRMGQTRLCKLA